MKIPFVKPPLLGHEEGYILEAIRSGHHDGNGPFTKKCHSFIESQFDVKKTLLTTSCTDALEMAAYLVDAQPGDEFIVPSYTFSSTATAFVSRGLKPIFVDIRNDTLNIDETKIEALITKKTKAIVPIHYAGTVAEMDTINNIAKEHNLVVIEDAAQAVNSKYKGNFAGSLSDMGTYSFHATKSYSCGEGGALTLNNENFYERSEYLWEKGTDRSQVIKGLKNKYWWVDYGSSFLLSDILAAMLLAQLEVKDELQLMRKKLYDSYSTVLSPLKEKGLGLPYVPEECESNFHAFYLVFPTPEQRSRFLDLVISNNVVSYIGYIPLHSSPMGVKLGGGRFVLPVTDHVSERVVRLPFYLMSNDEINYACDVIHSCAKKVL
ncbi:dTDP-4-amino-4,6-dideoxygalactose transaminase [Paenibacillus hodogayensis]|uniref:dTDP-4-amino-4,6-dideoxygalactose transaminase n=1 Tax=Paenibacillus hodogayensis TaxID=279208 RepID=A0ABV5VRX5_9BACL